MQRTLMAGLVAALFMGCGGTPEEQQADNMNELADLLEDVTDKASAESAASDIRALIEDMAEVGKRMAERTGEVTPDSMKELTDATMRVQQAMMKAMTKPGVAEVLQKEFAKIPR